MSPFPRLIASIVLPLFCAMPAAAQEGGIPAEHHPWGRFPVGSWKLVRVTTDNLDALGNVTGVTITETKTTLMAADAASYTLYSEVTVETSGKRFTTPPKTTKLGYSGQAPGEGVTSKKAGDAEITINGRRIPCEVRQIRIDGQGTKYEGTVHFAANIPPYVLRKDGVASGAGDAPKTTSSVEVLALDMTYRVLADRRTVAFVRTIDKRPDRISTTIEATCDDIPGGEVAHSSQEQNEDGKVLRRANLELLDFHVANERPDENWGGRRRVIHRNRPRRGSESPAMPQRR